MIFAVVAALAAIAGVLIGMTGVGGVLLVPALTEWAQVPLERAIAASMLAFLCAGTFATVLHLRRAPVPVSTAAPLAASAGLGAVTGSLTVVFIAPELVRGFIAALALMSGVHAWVSAHAPGADRLPSPRTLAALGVLVGVGSALSGTGGPVLLLPILLALRTPAHRAVALALVVQVPISLSATVIHAVAGRIDYPLAALLSALLLAGILAGAAVSRRLSGHGLKRVVAVMLIAVGVWYGAVSLG